jgi:hypothetical protein
LGFEKFILKPGYLSKLLRKDHKLLFFPFGCIRMRIKRFSKDIWYETCVLALSLNIGLLRPKLIWIIILRWFRSCQILTNIIGWRITLFEYVWWRTNLDVFTIADEMRRPRRKFSVWRIMIRNNRQDVVLLTDETR